MPSWCQENALVYISSGEYNGCKGIITSIRNAEEHSLQQPVLVYIQSIEKVVSVPLASLREYRKELELPKIVQTAQKLDAAGERFNANAALGTTFLSTFNKGSVLKAQHKLQLYKDRDLTDFAWIQKKDEDETGQVHYCNYLDGSITSKVPKSLARLAEMEPEMRQAIQQRLKKAKRVADTRRKAMEDNDARQSEASAELGKSFAFLKNIKLLPRKQPHQEVPLPLPVPLQLPDLGV